MNSKSSSKCKNIFVILTSIISLCGCVTKINSQPDGPPEYDVDVSAIPNAIPKFEKYSTLGNPPFYIVNNKKYIVKKHANNFKQKGIASWYGKKFHGKTTSNGEFYDMLSMTAAHKELPLPTYLRVKNLDNNKQVIVRVNDRGPFAENRIIDLSYAAAKKLGMLSNGTANVYLESITISNTYSENKKIQNKNKLNHIYIQVGAFRNVFKAQKYANKIKNLINHNTIIYAGKIKNNDVYKIQVGPINSIKESEPIILSLKQYFSFKPLIIMR